LHEQNVKCSANVRGLINQRYNQLLSEVGINEGKIPGKNPEQLGMDKSTSLRAELYAKAYGEVIARFEQPIWHNSDCMPFKNIDIFRHSLQFMGCSDIFLCAQVCKVWNQSSNYLNQPQYGPFKSADIFRHTAQFLEYGDIFLCAQVCKAWNGLSKRLNWQQFFKNEGIPLVEEEKGKESNYKGEFRILYPMTISGRMSEKLFGNFHEEIPCISRAIFNKCYRPDPFELGKLMMHTFKIVVIPAFFERTSSAEFPFILDSKGDLQPVGTGEWTGEKLQIPNGIKNLKILCENPLAGKENLPVFSYFYDEILQQCKTCPDKISLCFMRTCIADESRNLPYQNQKALVEGRGFEVTSLRDRIFFDAVCILTSGTCPDARDSHWSFARTSDIIVLGNSSYQLGIGGFAPRAGADVHDNNYDDDFIGVVPGVPAEVLR